MNNRLVTMKGTQVQLHCSRPTAYRLIVNGQLEALHIGRALRITQRSIDEYIEHQISAEVSPTRNDETDG